MTDRPHETAPISEQEAKQLADGFVAAEREAIRLLNVVRNGIWEQLETYFEQTGETRVVGKQFTISAFQRPFWSFPDREAALAVLEKAGCLRLVFEPQNANFARLLDRPDLPGDARKKLEKLAVRCSTWNLDWEPTEDKA